MPVYANFRMLISAFLEVEHLKSLAKIPRGSFEDMALDILEQESDGSIRCFACQLLEDSIFVDLPLLEGKGDE